MTVDASGNVYAVGYHWGPATYTFGPGISSSPTTSKRNAVMVKYNSSGAAQWVRGITNGSDDSEFNGVAVDASGNVYVAGRQYGTSAYDYGNSITLKGAMTSYNPVLLKYDSGGTALAIRSAAASSGPIYSASYNGIVIGGDGSLYLVGCQNGQTTYSYGAGVTATSALSGNNALIVKYDSSCTAIWARAVSGSSSPAGFGSEYTAVAISSDGNLYLAGYLDGIGTREFGGGVSATGLASLYSPLVVKFDSSGNAQWARTITSGTTEARFENIAIGPTGSVYLVGYQKGTGTNTYGTGVTLLGSVIDDNALLVKYDSLGNCQWIRSASSGSSFAYLRGVAIDSSDQVYALGLHYGSGTWIYGNGVSAGSGGIILKYDSSGTAKWVLTISPNSNSTMFSLGWVDNAGQLYAAGLQIGTSTRTYSGQSVTGGSTLQNPVVVKYQL